MRSDFLSRAGWYGSAAFFLFLPLLKGDTPRLPVMLFEIFILSLLILLGL